MNLSRYESALSGSGDSMTRERKTGASFLKITRALDPICTNDGPPLNLPRWPAAASGFLKPRAASLSIVSSCAISVERRTRTSSGIFSPASSL